MSTKPDAAPAEATQPDLHLCPFCGTSPLLGGDHKDDCYLELSEKLKTANGANAIFLAEAVSSAWKKRYVPAGYKVVSESLDKEVLESWECQTELERRKVWLDSNTSNVHGILKKGRLAGTIYPDLFKHLKSLHESPEPRTSNDTGSQDRPD